MSIPFKPKRLLLKNAGKDEVRYVATKAFTQTIPLDILCKHISDQCSLTSSDVKGVVEALVIELELGLREGKSIHLGDLGILSVSLTSPVEEDPMEIKGEDVRVKKVTFLPSKRIKEKLRTARFERWKG